MCDAGLDSHHNRAKGRKTQTFITHDVRPGSRRVSPPFLALQATCRQIYSETALLPFTTNEYWYIDNLSLENCRPLFYNAQFRRIRYVSFRVSLDIDSAIGIFCYDCLRGMEAFPDLQEVTIHLDTSRSKAKRRTLLGQAKAKLEERVKHVVHADVKVVFRRGVYDKSPHDPLEDLGSDPRESDSEESD